MCFVCYIGSASFQTQTVICCYHFDIPPSLIFILCFLLWSDEVFRLLRHWNCQDFRKNSPDVNIKSKPSSSYLSNMFSIGNHFLILVTEEFLIRFVSQPNPNWTFRLLIESQLPDLRPSENFFNFILLEGRDLLYMTWNSCRLSIAFTDCLMEPSFTSTLGESNIRFWRFSNLISDWVWEGHCFFIQNRLRALLSNYENQCETSGFQHLPAVIPTRNPELLKIFSHADLPRGC
jgi:hypothetical protein